MTPTKNKRKLKKIVEREKILAEVNTFDRISFRQARQKVRKGYISCSYGHCSCCGRSYDYFYDY